MKAVAVCLGLAAGWVTAAIVQQLEWEAAASRRLKCERAAHRQAMRERPTWASKKWSADREKELAQQCR